MPVAFPFEMEVVVAKLMLNNLLCFLGSVRFIVLPANINVMRTQRIAAAACPQPRIEYRAMSEGLAEVFERYAFHPSLQRLIVHPSSPLSLRK